MIVEMETLRSKPLATILVSILLLVHVLSSNGLGQFTRALVITPEERLATDADKVIRDFVQLLHPEWDNGAWDLFIRGKRSMNPHFGVDGWSFAVLDLEQPVIYGFSPSAKPCSYPRPCLFSLPDPTGARFVGRIYQRGSRVEAYEGSRPEVAKKNSDFQKDVGITLSLKDLDARLIAGGAHYPASQQQSLRKFLEAEPLFDKYGFQIRSLQFCRSTGPADERQIAMFWSAQVFSAKFRQRYRITVEPFEGDVTGLLAIRKGDEFRLSCAP
jgi:hypothetical protein